MGRLTVAIGLTLATLAVLYPGGVTGFGYPAPPSPPRIYYGGFKPMVRGRTGKSYGSNLKRFANKPTRFLFKQAPSTTKQKYLPIAKYQGPAVRPVFQPFQPNYQRPPVENQQSQKRYPFGFKSLDAPAVTSSAGNDLGSYNKPYAIPPVNAGVLPLQGEASDTYAQYSFPPYRR